MNNTGRLRAGARFGSWFPLDSPHSGRYRSGHSDSTNKSTRGHKNGDLKYLPGRVYFRNKESITHRLSTSVNHRDLEGSVQRSAFRVQPASCVQRWNGRPVLATLKQNHDPNNALQNNAKIPVDDTYKVYGRDVSIYCSLASHSNTNSNRYYFPTYGNFILLYFVLEFMQLIDDNVMDVLLWYSISTF